MAKELLVNVVDSKKVHTEGYEADNEPIFLDEVTPESKVATAKETVVTGGPDSKLYLQE